MRSSTTKPLPASPCTFEVRPLRFKGVRPLSIRRLIIATLSLSLVCAGSAFLFAHSQILTDISSGQEPSAYVCPMHPQQRSDKPGRCPICQMELKPITIEDGITVGAGAHTMHQPLHGGFLMMVGDYHLELVELASTFRLYVSDAFSNPVSVEKMTGSLTARRQGEVAESGAKLALVPAAEGAYLSAEKPPEAEFIEVDVAVDVNGLPVQISMPLRMTAEGWITDLGCFARGAPLDDWECTRSGIRAGSPVALLVGDEEHPMLYVLVSGTKGRWVGAIAAEKLLPWVDQRVRVTGKPVQRGSVALIQVESILPAGSPQQ